MKTHISILPFIEKIKDTVVKRPVEILLILCLAVTDCLFYTQTLLFEAVLMTTAVLLPLAFIANTLFPKGNKLRKIYEAIILIGIICIITCMDERMIVLKETTGYYTIVFILSLEALLINNNKNDRTIIENMVTMAWAALQAGFVSLCIFGFLYAISIALDMILGLDIMRNVIDLPILLVMPTITLTLYDHQPRVTSIDNRAANVILNYVVTGAILIFTAIFYIYILKIIFTWELPNGGVVELCMWYLLLTIVSTGLYRMAKVSSFDWFYHWLVLISLPITILFWTAIITRIYEYGLTENRVYVVTIGIINMVLAFMAIVDKSRCFSATFYHTIGFFFILGLIPPLSAKNIAFFVSGYEGETTNVSEEEETIGRIKNEQSNQIDIADYRTAIFPEYDINTDRKSLIFIVKDDTIAEIDMSTILSNVAYKNRMTKDEVVKKAYGYETLPLYFSLNDTTDVVLNDMVILDGKVIGAEPNIMLVK